MVEERRIDSGQLRSFGTEVYTRLGVPPKDAALIADTLVQADLWGHQSHGTMRLTWYAARMKSGVCKAVADPSFEVDTGPILVVDGHHGPGQVVTLTAIDEAIKRAKKYGIAAIAVRNSGHFGTAMYYTLRAAREGCVGFLATNTSPVMAPWGGRKKTVGNNPWSWSAPAGKYPPMVLDIANTAVARGKIYLARQRGESIPATWAMTAEGIPTTDPAEAIAGMIQPMGGHKGYSISVIMDMLAGVLAGGAFGTEVTGPYQTERRSGAGHFMIVLNIAAFQPLDAFQQRMERYIGELKSAPLAKGVQEIFYPGEIEARNDVKHRAQGLALPPETLADLRRIATELDLTSKLPS